MKNKSQLRAEERLDDNGGLFMTFSRRPCFFKVLFVPSWSWNTWWEVFIEDDGVGTFYSYAGAAPWCVKKKAWREMSRCLCLGCVCTGSHEREDRWMVQALISLFNGFVKQHRYKWMIINSTVSFTNRIRNSAVLGQKWCSLSRQWTPASTVLPPTTLWTHNIFSLSQNHTKHNIALQLELTFVELEVESLSSSHLSPPLQNPERERALRATPALSLLVRTACELLNKMATACISNIRESACKYKYFTGRK